MFVCDDKSKVSIDQIKTKLKAVNKEIICGKHILLEGQYIGINEILVEAKIKTTNERVPEDYKFFCFNGEPKFLFVGTERDREVKFDFFDIDFNWLDLRNGHQNNKKNRPTKPKKYEEMLDLCRILSKGFRHVRVDLYNVDGKIYFGELTFYHNGGMVPFKPRKWDYEFGKYFGEK